GRAHRPSGSSPNRRRVGGSGSRHSSLERSSVPNPIARRAAVEKSSVYFDLRVPARFRALAPPARPRIFFAEVARAVARPRFGVRDGDFAPVRFRIRAPPRRAGRATSSIGGISRFVTRSVAAERTPTTEAPGDFRAADADGAAGAAALARAS